MPTRVARPLTRLVATCAVLLAAGPARAQAPASPEIPDSVAGAKLERILGWLNGGELGDVREHFGEAFLAAVPPGQLDAVRAQLFGRATTTLLRIDDIQDDGRLLVTTVAVRQGENQGEDTGEDTPTEYYSLLVGVDTDDMIQTLLVRPGLGPREDAAESWADLDDRLDAFPGEVAAGAFELDPDPLVTDVTPIWVRGEDRSLALGSAFKLWVLGAVAERVRDGAFAWDDTFPIVEAHKSLPSGQMQTEPEGAEFTLQHFATEMIRVSDNTATDHLIRLVGRDTVEAFVRTTGADDPRNHPFLTTKEMFQVKLGGDLEARDAFAAAGEAERRAMLEPGGAIGSIRPSLMLANFWLKPVLIDSVEWFATPAELAQVMAHLRRLEAEGAGEGVSEAITQNPGLAFDAEVWPVIGYKGGSEPGVLNMTYRLHRDDGRVFCLTFGWNDTADALQNERLFALVRDAAALLADWDR